MQVNAWCPSPETLRTMSPADIGRRVLPSLRQYHERGFAPRDLARGFGEQYGQFLSREMMSLYMEGLWWLMRQGLLVEDPTQMVGATWYRLSRDGLAFIATSRTPTSLAVDAPVRTLLHPRILASAVPIYERDADSHVEAVAVAFIQVETMTRERIKAVRGSPSSESGIKLFSEAFNPPDGVLLLPGIDSGEAHGLRNLFAGAYGALRNPHAHGFVRFESDEEVLRLLVVASQLLTMLERLPRAVA